MTQGVWAGGKRPASKKAFKEAVAADPTACFLQATSWFGNEYDGPVSGAPNGTYYFVGPDPERNRKYFGQVIVKDGKVTVK